jgi:RNA polymerase sigma-70 factor (ECF subfamily)
MNSELLETVSLLKRYKSGEQECLNTLYEKYRERLNVIIRSRMGAKIKAKVDSEDLVQSVMLESFKDIERFEYKTEGAFLHWLGAIATNKIREKSDYFGAKKRDVGKEVPQEEGLEHTSKDPSPSLVVSQKEDYSALYEALDKLGEKERELVIMNKIEGLSYVEIAEINNTLADSVGKSIRRALIKISQSGIKLG